MINHIENKVKNSQIRKIHMLEVRIKELESDKEFYRTTLSKMLDKQEKIDIAIAEIEERKKYLHTDIYNGDSIEFGKGLDLALKILKEHIGE